QLTEQAAELEPGLIAAVVGRRRSPDRRDELAAPDDLVAYRRNVVLPTAAAQEAQVSFAVVVPPEDVTEMARELDLAEGRRQLEPPGQPVCGRDLREQLRDALGADRVEELALLLARR